ncbi:MAG: hypothetical protein WCR87_07500, partial [Saccharofermentanales bacterium]
FGRDAAIHGYPIRMSEMLSTLDGAAFIQRVSMHDVRNVREAKKAIAKAFRLQSEGAGFTMVEILSTCPTNWGIDPVGSLEWIKEMMIPQYPLGVYKDVTAGGDK